MKAKIPKSWFSLPKAEQEAIKNAITEQFNDELNRLLDEEDAKLLKIYMKLCCIVLHNNFGWGEGRCSQFLGSWKSISRRLKKMQTEKEQADFITPQIDAISKNGYPSEFIDGL